MIYCAHNVYCTLNNYNLTNSSKKIVLKKIMKKYILTYSYIYTFRTFANIYHDYE